MRRSRCRVALAAASLTLLVATPVGGAASRHGPALVGRAPVVRIDGADPWDTAAAVSRATFSNATTVVVARIGVTAAVAAPLAVAVGGPLLLVPDRGVPQPVADELHRLGAAEVIIVGGPGQVPPATEAWLRGQVSAVTRIAGATPAATAALVAARLPAGPAAVVVDAAAREDALAAAAVAAPRALPVLLLSAAAVPPETAEALRARGTSDVTVVGTGTEPGRLAADALAADGRRVHVLSGTTPLETAALAHDAARAGGSDNGELWLAAAPLPRELDRPAAVIARMAGALAALPAAAVAGASLLFVDGENLRGPPATAARIRVAVPALRRVVLVGGSADVDADAAVQLNSVVTSRELPGGGHRLFPDRRVVAFYGSGTDARLGVLGETDASTAAARLRTVATAYGTPGRQVLPALELIASTAQRVPGPDGDYSKPTPHEVVQRYLHAARAADALLLLDLQPGRQDFVTDLRRFDDVLLEPNVGVALDPEWRVGPDGVPGETAGSVTAGEVLAVATHLAHVVRRHGLPEKLLVVHRFTEDMLVGADDLVAPEGVQLLVDADGIGDPDAKRRAYVRWTAGDRMHDGLMLFLKRDAPGVLSSEEVLALRPDVDLVAYQ